MLGKKINFYRRVRNCRIEDLAAVLGVTRQAVMKWEAGKSVPDVLTMKKMSDYLSVPLDKFLEEAQEKEREKMENSESEENKEMVSEEGNIELGPEEKFFLGRVTVGTNGQINIPQEAMKKFGIQPGDRMLLLGDLERGFEIIYEDILWNGVRNKLWNDAHFSMTDDTSEKN